MKPRKLRLARAEKGTPLAHLVRAHRQFRPRGSLAGNLGDGFLCALHPVFRNVRAEALRRGIRFSDKENQSYYAFPLMALDDVIASRVIPYRANFAWVERLEKERPGAFTLPDLKRGELQFNYLFHESAHLIAHDELFGRRHPRSLPRNAGTLLGVMVGEAFANMVECLSAAFAEGEIGSYFLDANCHFRANEEEVRALLAAGKRWGWDAVARALLGAFLYSNYLFERLNAAELARVAELAGLPKGARIGRLVRIGLQLNEKFRTVTTPLHLRKTGFGAELPGLFRADPLRLLLSPANARLREGAVRLAGIASRGLTP